MHKTSVYTLVDGNIKELAHRKKQKSQKVIMPASHCVNVLLNNINFCEAEYDGQKAYVLCIDIRLLPVATSADLHIRLLPSSFGELTIVISVTNLSVRRTDRSTELYVFSRI